MILSRIWLLNNKKTYFSRYIIHPTDFWSESQGNHGFSTPWTDSTRWCPKRRPWCPSGLSQLSYTIPLVNPSEIGVTYTSLAMEKANALVTSPLFTRANLHILRSVDASSSGYIQQFPIISPWNSNLWVLYDVQNSHGVPSSIPISQNSFLMLRFPLKLKLVTSPIFSN